MLTAEEKIKEVLAANALRFQHEGTHVVRWLTGGTAPSVYVTFEQQGEKIVTRCPSCGEPLGRFNASYSGATSKQIAAIREVGAHHHC